LSAGPIRKNLGCGTCGQVRNNLRSAAMTRKKKIKKAASRKLQAPSSVDNGSGIM